MGGGGEKNSGVEFTDGDGSAGGGGGLELGRNL